MRLTPLSLPASAESSPTAMLGSDDALGETETVTPSLSEGAKVLSDDFENPALGLLPQESFDPTAFRMTYEEGEYVVQNVDPEIGTILSEMPNAYADASIAVDARLVGDVEGRYLAVGCRSTADDDYRFLVDPGTQYFHLARWMGSQETILRDGYSRDEINPCNEANRLQISCVGTPSRAASMASASPSAAILRSRTRECCSSWRGSIRTLSRASLRGGSTISRLLWGRSRRPTGRITRGSEVKPRAQALFGY